MLKQRILTAVILIPLVLAAILWLDITWFALLFALIVTLGAREWAILCGLKQAGTLLYSLFIIFVLTSLFFLENQAVLLVTVYIAGAFWLLALVAVILYQTGKNILPDSSLVMMFVGVVLLVPTWSSLVYLKSSFVEGSILIIYLLFLIWAADSGAYFIGRKWGRSKLANRVSPGKTWEGTIAGIFSGLFVTMVYILFSGNTSENDIPFIGISILVVLVSVVGDLTESMVKRKVNIKDSGSLLPGHGGVLDRIDSLTAAAPVFTLGLVLTGIYI